MCLLNGTKVGTKVTLITYCCLYRSYVIKASLSHFARGRIISDYKLNKGCSTAESSLEFLVN